MVGGLLLGGACGASNGVLTARTGLCAFIVTLATMSAFKGINLGITQAQPFYGIPDSVKAAGNAALGRSPAVAARGPGRAGLVGLDAGAVANRSADPRRRRER